MTRYIGNKVLMTSYNNRVMQLRNRICMQEYVSSKDVSESRHCPCQLAVPFFHHEFVKQASLSCMEEKEDSSNEVQLLKQLASTGDISKSHMAKVA